MEDNDRGKIRNREHVPTKDYSGIRYDKITPTDIDGFIDFGNKLFVFVELKFGSSPLKYGQKLAIERLCDACQNNERNSVVLIARYYMESEDAVDIAPLLVDEYRFRGKWYRPKKETTVRRAIDNLLFPHYRGCYE